MAYPGSMTKSDMHVQGEIDCGSQYHFTMETQTALVVPGEGDTYKVHSATQWVNYVQAAVANVLGIPSSRCVMCIAVYYCTLGYTDHLRLECGVQ